MSPRPRGPNPFDRWARSESGLHLPSRLVPRAAKRLHHIEKFGQAQCCCENCGLWSGTRPSTVTLVVDGFVDGSCSCSDFNTTYELDFNEEKSPQGPTEEYPYILCMDWYEYTPPGDPTGHVMARVIFTRTDESEWTLEITAWARCPGNQFTPYFYMSAEPVPEINDYESAFQTGQTYSLNGAFTGFPGQCPGVSNPGMDFDVYT